MQISDNGLALIREFEGLRLTAYKCPAGVWTIGYGHTGADVAEGKTITPEMATAFLKTDVRRFERAISELISVDLDQGQFDALVSWAFNVGAGAVQRSTLRRRLNAGAYEDVPGQLMRWTKAGGRELPGLVRRRRAECALWRGMHENPVDIPESRAVDEPALKPITDSRTMKGGIPALAGAATAAGGLFSALGSLDPLAQAIIGGGLTIALLGAGYVLWNRWQERKRGER